MNALTSLTAPACMDEAELAMWAAGNGITTGTKNGRRVYACRAASPCDDCTLGYAADMRAIGRCDGTPGGVEEDDEMETPAAYAATTELRTRVTVVAPCGTCIHARVCRLRPADELDVAVELPQLDAALMATLTATVECMEYARAPKTKGGAQRDAAPADPYGLTRPKREISPEARERLRQGAMKTQAILAARRAEADA